MKGISKIIYASNDTISLYKMWNPTVHYNQHYAWQQIDIVQKNGEELKKKYNSPKYITNTAGDSP
jgi:hypothetical protein